MLNVHRGVGYSFFVWYKCIAVILYISLLRSFFSFSHTWCTAAAGAFAHTHLFNYGFFFYFMSFIMLIIIIFFCLRRRRRRRRGSRSRWISPTQTHLSLLFIDSGMCWVRRQYDSRHVQFVSLYYFFFFFSSVAFSVCSCWLMRWVYASKMFIHIA